MPGNIYALQVQPGIQRDGTPFSTRNWIDGEWCRFYRSLPKKIGGYKQIFGELNNVLRGTFLVNNSPNFNIYIGDYQSLRYFTIDSSGLAISGLIDRTPDLFNVNVYNEWMFDLMFSTVNDSGILVAHAPPNLFSIESTTDSLVYYGDMLSNDKLVSTGFQVSGGIVALNPYLFMYGNDGNVMWTEANDPTTLLGEARVTSRKIVKGLPTRGGNSSPAGLLWSLDSLIRITQVGTTSVEFSFDTITSQSSILSSNGVIEYDGIFYWAGQDRFLFYNGVVQELPNSMNLRYFFDNLNYAQRQKVWATKVTKFGEIWWFYPTGSNTECDKAVIYNIRERTWYDSSITRSSGYFEQTFGFPIWTDSMPDSFNQYNVWIHEKGVDKDINGDVTAIPSHFQSCNIAWCAINPDGQQAHTDNYVDIYRFEPDFIQSGDMTLTVKGKEYARSPVVSSSPFTFSDTTEKIDLREQRREMTLRFDSNTIGGNYEMGQNLMVMRIGDRRT